MTQPILEEPHVLITPKEQSAPSYESRQRGSWKSDFILTQQYLRFRNFCAQCRYYRTIGLVYGVSGVGKTRSARTYANWEFFEQQLPSNDVRCVSLPAAGTLPPRTALYTPPAGASAKRLESELRVLLISLALIADSLVKNEVSSQTRPGADFIDLIIIDEANRLSEEEFEVIRDLHDRYHFGIIFLGLPNVKGRLSTFPQLSTRTAFFHPFPLFQEEEVRHVLHRKFLLGQFPLHYENQITNEIVSSITQMTGGNFKALDTLLMHIDHILYVNKLPVLNLDIIKEARATILSGQEPVSPEKKKRSK